MASDLDRRAAAELGRAHPRSSGGPLILVVDASVVAPACAAVDGFGQFGREELVAPPLLWPEVRATLHLAVFRGRTSAELGRAALERLEKAPIRARDHARLGREAWRVADEFGWGRTYDAEYVALAQLLGCRLVTNDVRLHRGAARLGFVVRPTEL